jgi:predicted nucleic acid-binding protein
MEKTKEQYDVKDCEKYISRKEALAKKLWALALSGDITAIKYIYDRIDGKPDEFHRVESTENISFTDAIQAAYDRRKNAEISNFDSGD